MALEATGEKLFGVFPILRNEWREKLIIIQSKPGVDYLFDQLGLDWAEFKDQNVESQFNYCKGGTAYNLGYNI